MDSRMAREPLTAEENEKGLCSSHFRLHSRRAFLLTRDAGPLISSQ
jgi:hypothetical protein